MKVTSPVTQLKSNEQLLLNQPDSHWQIDSGSIALFCIPSPNGANPTGKRRYLSTVQAGEMMFCPLAAARMQILAVALEDSCLTPIRAAQFETTIIEQPHRAIAHLEAWINRLSTALSGISSPKLLTPIDRIGILGTEEVFQPAQGAVRWVQCWSPSVQLLGSLVLNHDGPIPLTSHLWIQAQSPVEIEIYPQTSIQNPAVFLSGFTALQELLLHGLEQLENQARDRDMQRFWQRKTLDESALAQTQDEFAKLFAAKAKGKRLDPLLAQQPETLNAALLAATGAVGRALDITISPPAASEDQRRSQEPLEAIARASHIRIRRVTLRDEWWTQDNGPLLAYCEADRRPVALLPMSAHRYDVFDPMEGRRYRCSRSFADGLSPTAYTFYRPLPKAQQPLDLLKFALRGHGKEFLVVILTGVAATLVGMVTPQATAILIDQAIPNGDRKLLWQLALGLLSTAVGASLFQLTQGFAIQRLETFADASTQAAVWDRLLNLKMSFFRSYSIGDLSARVSAVSQIRSALSNTLLKSLFSSIFSLLNLGLLFCYSVPLALIATGVAGVNIGVTIASGRLTLKKVRPMLDQQGKLFGTMVQLINGVAKFRIAGAENRAFAYWGQRYSHQLKLSMGTQSIDDNLAVINQLLSVLTPVILFLFAASLMQQPDSKFSTGTFLAFNAAFGTFIAGATSLSSTAVDILQIWPLWERSQPILQALPELDDSKADPGRLSGRLTIDHAVFRYQPEGRLILDDVSIQAEPGEFIALVGPSGSGKSTLLRLLLGFDLPESGTIGFDGQDLAGLDMNAVRRQLGVVLQNSRLMAGSIFDNIASSALISMDEAWEAARMAGFGADVENMPMGMHTVVSEGGSNLSGGQRQRLLIARALALRPRILLFDEATSALDNKTQAIVTESLDRLKVTRIVVAHRLSTVRNADRIYVLQDGRMRQVGSYDALAKEEGLFKQMIQRQKV
jgi:NHLM bacteriocin system ABC transporter ATP-binding protein